VLILPNKKGLILHKAYHIKKCIFYLYGINEKNY